MSQALLRVNTKLSLLKEKGSRDNIFKILFNMSGQFSQVLTQILCMEKKTQKTNHLIFPYWWIFNILSFARCMAEYKKEQQYSFLWVGHASLKMSEYKIYSNYTDSIYLLSAVLWRYFCVFVQMNFFFWS